MPALLKSTSIRSNRLTTLSARATVCASSVTSTCSATASPAAPIASTVPCAASRSTSATTTRPPSLTKSEALARPIPLRSLIAIVPFIRFCMLFLAGLVLTLACMNVGNILLVRATVRQRMSRGQSTVSAQTSATRCRRSSRTKAGVTKL